MKRAAALEQAHMELPVQPYGGEQAKRRRRGIGLGGVGAQQEHRTVARLCAYLQAPQLIRPRLRQPREHGAGAVGLDELFGRPQPLGWRGGLDPDQLSFMHAGVPQPRQVRVLGRPDDRDLAATCGDTAQGATEQAPFELCGLRAKDFREGLAGPAATGQLAIELRPSRFDDARNLPAELRPAP